MPPARARAPIDDTKSEARERTSAATAAGTTTRPRKTAAAVAVTANSGKDSTSAPPANGAAARNGNTTQPPTVAPGITWTAEDSSLLHAYRNAYALPAPPAFHSALAAAVLTAPGVGRHSPTTVRQRDKRRVPKETLALAVRKHFNGLAVNETDVVVDFLYSVKMQDRGFKVRFAPKRQR